MNSSNRLTRVAVLFSFILLLSGFVAYRTGTFDKWLGNRKQNDAAASGLSIADYMLDTIPKIDSVPYRPTTIMSSSKSIIVPAHIDYLPIKDKKKRKYKMADTAGTVKKEEVQTIMMYGSKSAPVFTPKTPVIVPKAPVTAPKSDTVKKNK